VGIPVEATRGFPVGPKSKERPGCSDESTAGGRGLAAGKQAAEVNLHYMDESTDCARGLAATERRWGSRTKRTATRSQATGALRNGGGQEKADSRGTQGRGGGQFGSKLSCR